MKFDILGISRKSVKKIKVSLKPGKNNGHLYTLYAFYLSYLPQLFLEWGMFQTTVVERLEIHFMFINFFPPKIVPFMRLLTPWCRVLLEKLTDLQLVKKFPAFHGTRRFITSLTSVRHLSLSWASPIQSTYPHSTSWKSIVILPTHLRLGLPSRLFPSGFLTKTLYTPLSSPIRATCPAHLIPLGLWDNVEKYRRAGKAADDNMAHAHCMLDT